MCRPYIITFCLSNQPTQAVDFWFSSSNSFWINIYFFEINLFIIIVVNILIFMGNLNNWSLSYRDSTVTGINISTCNMHTLFKLFPLVQNKSIFYFWRMIPSASVYNNLLRSYYVWVDIFFFFSQLHILANLWIYIFSHLI